MQRTINQGIHGGPIAAALLLLVLAGHVRVAGADDDRFTASNEKWRAECGSCHVAYPPQLLAQESWQKLMSGLDKHFGADASLDPAAAAEIGTFLSENAARGKRAARAGSALRITETAWFRKEHRKVSAATWKNSKVKSPANCTACHTGAERGNYSEHSISVPR